ncbi:MAG: DNA/RNA nuclease SfsA, partial [Pseudomonadota bacterium]
MQFSSPLVSGRLVKRYKRFLCDVVLDDGTEITASCPNTGSMMGLTTPGNRVWCSTNDNPKRKYRHTLELVGDVSFGDETVVGINTGHPNKIVAEAIAGGRIASL